MVLRFVAVFEQLQHQHTRVNYRTEESNFKMFCNETLCCGNMQLTLGAIWQRYQFATFASPGYRRSWRSRGGTLEGYVGALTYYHIGAGRVVQYVGWHCCGGPGHVCTRMRRYKVLRRHIIHTQCGTANQWIVRRVQIHSQFVCGDEVVCMKEKNVGKNIVIRLFKLLVLKLGILSVQPLSSN